MVLDRRAGLHLGCGAFEQLRSISADTPGPRVLLMTTVGGERRWGARARALLKACEVHSFTDAPVNPTVADAEHGIKAASPIAPHWILAIGGGSVIDLAKTVAVCMAGASLKDAMHGATRLPALPIIAVPTTSGTGSEVTCFATLWDTEAKKKRSLEGEALCPRAAIVDPELCASMPAHVTATSGMDALSHAIESYWSRRATPESDRLSLEAAAAIVQNLPLAIATPTDLVARHAMARAATTAGLAICQTRTAASHAISYPLTLFHGVEHGLACSIALRALLPLNAEALGDLRAQALFRALGAASADEAATRIEALMRRAGLPTRLRDLGLSHSDLDVVLAESFTPGRMDNNVRALDRTLVRGILEAIY